MLHHKVLTLFARDTPRRRARGRYHAGSPFDVEQHSDQLAQCHDTDPHRGEMVEAATLNSCTPAYTPARVRYQDFFDLVWNGGRVYTQGRCNGNDALDMPRENRMAEPQPRYSKEEFARRGDEIYERAIRPHIEAGNAGKFVVIDIETGAHEVAADELAASDRLLARHPDAQVWLRRIGSRYVRRFGPRSPSDVA
jgi:hypothetical protein